MKRWIILLIILIGLSGCIPNGPDSGSEEAITQLRVITTGEGFFQVSRKECENLGFFWNDPESIGLIHQGEEYPFWFEVDPNTGMETIKFYSPSNPPDINLSENVFILSKQDNISHRRLTPIKINSSLLEKFNISSGKYSIHFENQDVYVPQAGNEDHWLWSILNPDQPIGTDLVFPVMPGENLKVSFQVWNPAEVSNISDQKFILTINGNEYPLQKNVSAGWQVLEINIDHFSINQENEIQIQYMDPMVGYPHKLYLDWIEIQYYSQIELGKFSQSFYIEQDPIITDVQASGSLILFDENNIPVNIYSVHKTTGLKIPNPEGIRATWIPDGGFSQVVDLSPIEDLEVISLSDGIDFLIIVPQNMQPSLNQFKDMKQNQGLKVATVSPQEIYDAINSGYPSPDAIKKFIQQLYDRSAGNLKYVLLVGDYSYEIVDYDQIIEFVPSYFIETSPIGETISDAIYSDMNNDNFPEIAIGRIPASTNDQLETWIEKVIAYEENFSGYWAEISAIVDGSDPLYEKVANDFVLSFQPEIKTIVLVDPPWLDLDAAFTNQNSLIMFFGHGSIDLWGKNKILSTTKSIIFSKANVAPLVLSFSCLNGYFIHPEIQSLAEALLFTPNKGSVGVYTFSGQTLAIDQETLIKDLSTSIRSNHYTSIGALLKGSVMDIFPKPPLDVDIIKSSIYFGDPSMRIPQNFP